MTYPTSCKRALKRALSCLCFCLCLFLCLDAHAQEASGRARYGSEADLLTLLKRAENIDPQLASARLAYQADQEGVPRARAGFFPQITGGWARTHNQIKAEGLPSVSYTQNGWQVSLTQPLFNWDIWTTYKQSELAEAKSAILFAQAYQELFLRVANTYFAFLAARDDLRLTGTYRQSLKEQLKVTKLRFRGGEATLVDVRDIEAAIDRAQMQEISAQGLMETKRQDLEEIFGGPLARIAGLRQDVSVPGVMPDDMSIWIAQAKRNNFDVQLQEIARKTADLETSKAKGAHLPTISLNASHSPVGAAGGFGTPTTTNTVMLQVSIPIFSGFETQYRVRQALALEEKANSDLDAAERKSVGAVRESFFSMQTDLQKIQSLANAVRSSSAALDANKIGYRVGGRSDSDVLQAKNALLTTQRDLAHARYDLLTQGLRLKSLTASLEFADIAAINGLLEDTNEQVPNRSR
ncbi:TolC family outer membrane protein [Herbaspirillum sp. CF444]|uniref:TolC family outer membrane protein n=1 Tax=Herbaspirillum sp. CF444 TaxID=1144319 RepID=UPI0009D9E559|nr:TolC family outer membrane protein [Herbaspirillum sp. CF444]